METYKEISKEEDWFEEEKEMEYMDTDNPNYENETYVENSTAYWDKLTGWKSSK